MERVGMYRSARLLPLKDKNGRAFPRAKIQSIQERPVRKFGGLHRLSPRGGKYIWVKGGKQQSNDIIVVEVFAPKPIDADGATSACGCT